jgi:hypothetical protein
VKTETSKKLFKPLNRGIVMFNIKTTKLCLFMGIISLIVCLHGFVLAEDCADKKDAMQTPTPPGNTEYTDKWRDQYGPTIYDDDGDDMIGPGGSVSLWVDSRGLACPPYNWSTSSTGWSLSSSETNNDLETVTLSLIDTTGKTCGTDFDVYATVTVTDDCGVTDDIIVRYSGGKWVVLCSNRVGGYFCGINKDQCFHEYPDAQPIFYFGHYRVACNISNYWRCSKSVLIPYTATCGDYPPIVIENNGECPPEYRYVSRYTYWEWSCP